MLIYNFLQTKWINTLLDTTGYHRVQASSLLPPRDQGIVRILCLLTSIVIPATMHMANVALLVCVKADSPPPNTLP